MIEASVSKLSPIDIQTDFVAKNPFYDEVNYIEKKR